MAVIYFIQIGEDGPIKIGFTEGAAEVRLAGIQVGSPWRLKVVASRKGVYENEQAVHQVFSHLRMIGEWFEPHATLLSFIKTLSLPTFKWPTYTPKIKEPKNSKFCSYKVAPQIPHERIDPILRHNIKLLTDAFLKLRNIKLTTLSKKVRGDKHFLSDYLNGKVGVTIRKYDDIAQWFEDHWPEGTDMPTIKGWHPK